MSIINIIVIIYNMTFYPQSGVLTRFSMNFTLHTEPSVSPPEFTITCHTQGGPATTVEWSPPNDVTEDSDYQTSQLIVDTSSHATYENRLRVRGRESGSYVCIIRNNLQNYLTEAKNELVDGLIVEGKNRFSL